MVTASRLIPVRVGDIEIEVEAVPVARTEPTSGRPARPARVAGEASLKVTLGYEITARPSVVPPAGVALAGASDAPGQGPSAGPS